MAPLLSKLFDKRYGDSTPGKSTIIDWYAEFKRGRTSINDAERSGRPKSVVVPENITKVIAAFAHTRPKTTKRRGFRALFGVVQAR